MGSFARSCLVCILVHLVLLLLFVLVITGSRCWLVLKSDPRRQIPFLAELRAFNTRRDLGYLDLHPVCFEASKSFHNDSLSLQAKSMTS